MRGVITYVKCYVSARRKFHPKFFEQWPDREVHLHPPLQIKAATSDTELQSSTSPWTKLIATASLRKHRE
eukprot:1268143-Lingulodinium_polyedra.AAC.1